MFKSILRSSMAQIFILGLLALIITQIGFAKGTDTSKLVPMYNSLI